ncbi:VWA domain-containing protein [Nocardioides zeae]|uniref:VWA domain-containing protein n=1 Tax=Nocardioides zeae TaxID=1457234 RepID=UPI003083FFDC
MTAPPGAPSPDEEELVARRWRLVLGPSADDALGRPVGEDARLDDALGFLEEGTSRTAGSTGSGFLTSTDWINEVQELFPRSVADRLVERAVETRGVDDLVLDAEALAAVTPSQALLTAILRNRSLMAPHVLAAARTVVAQVVAELVERLATPVRNPFTGVRDPRRPSRQRVAANFDARATIRANLRNVDPVSGQLVIKRPLFASRVRRQVDRWQVIVAVDQSGSMAGSVIHSAVTAAIFHGVGSIRTHLVAFDTEVVDLSDQLADPVEVLLGVQLGGGTDIGKAVRYCASLVTEPRRAIVVVISDFFEGGDVAVLRAAVRELAESGVTVLALAALEEDGTVTVHEDEARELARLGAHVGAMTPDVLAQWVAEVVDGRREAGPPAAPPAPSPGAGPARGVSR